jgi:hypothetical protein
METLVRLWPLFAYIVAYVLILITFQAIAWTLYFRSLRRRSTKTRGSYYP